MIVDLLRNDLGRIARPGTVRWSKVFEPERFETVWQLTSTVTAELDAGMGVPDVFLALFPSGSITGAPKVRTMGIIADLEDAPRGVYCGAVGFLAPETAGPPRASFNVAIRTVVVDAETQDRRVRRRRRHHMGLVVRPASTTRPSRRRGCSPRGARRSSCSSRCDATRASRSGRLERHVGRLRSSAAYFGFSFDDDAVRTALDGRAPVPDRPIKIRLRLTRASARSRTRGRSLDRGAPEPAPPGDRRHARWIPRDVFLFHKTTLRRRYEDARARHPDADDVILVNRRGEVTETSVANIAAKLGGDWWTPPLDAGLFAGTERAASLDDGTLRSVRSRSDELADGGGARRVQLGARVAAAP